MDLAPWTVYHLEAIAVTLWLFGAGLPAFGGARGDQGSWDWGSGCSSEETTPWVGRERRLVAAKGLHWAILCME
jgi:hypothetical protein